MGGPGGNNPLAFGKSKAKFQMEPNTGITFDDVAGVDEAKQDFMEVRPRAERGRSIDEVFAKSYCPAMLRNITDDRRMGSLYSFTPICVCVCVRASGLVKKSDCKHVMRVWPDQVVEFLKRPERFTAVGARIPKGVLLVGPPGTGMPWFLLNTIIRK